MAGILALAATWWQVARLYIAGAVVVAALGAIGWHQVSTSWSTWRANRAGEAAVSAALDHAHEMARRHAVRATDRAREADAAAANIETLQGMLADAQTKSIAAADLARCVTPLDRVRLLRAAVAGSRGKSGATAAAAR